MKPSHPNVEPHPHEIPSQYQKFKDVFEKKFVNILLKHRPYDCTIDLVERVQPPFKTIYNLLQDELVVLHEYTSMRTSKRGSFDIQNLQLAPLSFLVKKKDGYLRICVNYYGLN
jgi:hypothetical protein